MAAAWRLARPTGVAAPVTREWNYWTLNKLAILGDYLPAFNVASKRAPQRVYIDLMAGQPNNIERGTGQVFDGSARLAMSADPGFSRLAFIEKDAENARALRDDLADRFPGDTRARVYSGDCNVVIDEVLRDLAGFRRAPTFAFVDQHAAEVHWSTLAKVAHFRSGERKTELWVLMSPALIIKGARGTNGEAFSQRVDALYGSGEWRHILNARDREDLSASQFRDEMVNLFRWRLEEQLGYQVTARIPMHMENNVPLYDMVFATDHFVGESIMTSLYKKAALREPRMRDELRVRRLNEDDSAALFPVTGEMLAETDTPRWEKSPTWDPRETSWWR